MVPTEPQEPSTNDQQDEHSHAEANTPPVNPAAEQAPAPPQPVDPNSLKVVDTKVYGITGMQKEVLANFLNVQALNQFNLRAHLQMLAETQWGITADQFTRFGLDLDQNKITVELLEPIKPGEQPTAPGLEAAPPAPSN